MILQTKVMYVGVGGHAVNPRHIKNNFGFKVLNLNV